MVRPALDQLLLRLELRCRLETGPDQAVGELLRAEDPWARGQAAMAAGERGLHQFVDLLTDLAREEDTQVCLPAIGALGRLRARGTIPQLVECTRGAPDSVVRAVAVALADMGGAEARPYLKQWAAHHPSAAIRELVTRLLAE